MIETENSDTNWALDPRTMQRLWPVIDVHGRINRALRAQAGRSFEIGSDLAGNGSAA